MMDVGGRKGNWLQVQNAEDEIQPSIFTLTNNCMTLCDIKCDNYTNLIVADIDFKDEEKPKGVLKVFRGTNLISEQTLNGIPSAIESFYVQEIDPKTPVLAVAISESILFFRNLKPYFKFTVPETEGDEFEKDLWRKLPVISSEQQEAIISQLKNADCSRLGRKSQRLLQLSVEEREAFIKTHSESPVTRSPSIVAMRSLCRISSEFNPPAHLVIATNDGSIFVLEAQSFSILQRARTCAYETTPSLLVVQGTYETDYRIVIATRNGSVYLLRKTETEGQEIFKMSYPLTGLLLLPVDQTIIATSMDQRLVCYSKKGKQIYCLPLASLPTCLLPITLNHLGVTLVCVAFEGGLVQFYMQRYLVDQFKMEETVCALLFGRMGLEEHVLSMVTNERKLFVKILKRTAIFEPLRSTTKNGYATSEHSIVVKPQKSSIFVEQAAREKQNPKVSYGGFQVELWRLRHTAAKVMFAALNISETTISSDLTYAPLKLSAEVCGIGPIYRLYIVLQNLSTYKMASNLKIFLHTDRRLYSLPISMAKLPSILPGMPLKVDFEVAAVEASAGNKDVLTHIATTSSAQVRVTLTKSKHVKPLIAALVLMPQSEANLS